MEVFPATSTSFGRFLKLKRRLKNLTFIVLKSFLPDNQTIISAVQMFSGNEQC